MKWKRSRRRKARRKRARRRRAKRRKRMISCCDVFMS